MPPIISRPITDRNRPRGRLRPGSVAGRCYDLSMERDATEQLVTIAIARDEPTAQRWAEALLAAGIDAQLRIADGAHLSTLGSAYGGQMFTYPLLVADDDRRAAATVLVDLRGDGPFARRSSPRATLRGALIATGLAFLVVVLLIARGG